MVDPEGVLDQYQIQYVLFPAQQPVIHMLESSPHWKVIFNGQITTMLERVEPASSKLGSHGNN